MRFIAAGDLSIDSSSLRQLPREPVAPTSPPYTHTDRRARVAYTVNITRDRVYVERDRSGDDVNCLTTRPQLRDGGPKVTGLATCCSRRSRFCRDHRYESVIRRSRFFSV